MEKKPLENLCKQNQLAAFKHHGFWKCMDTIRDRDVLKEIYKKKEMKKCIFCRKKRLVRIVELGKQPLSGIFLDKKNKI